MPEPCAETRFSAAPPQSLQPAVQVGRYRFFCRAAGPVPPPLNLGHALRAALGPAVKRAVCLKEGEGCQDCVHKSHCLHVRVFEDARTDAGAYAAVSCPPKPFALVPSHLPGSPVAPDGRFTFDLLLFGRACKSLPHFFQAVCTMGDTGIGAWVHGSRARFRVERATDETGADVYTPDKGLAVRNGGGRWLRSPDGHAAEPVRSARVTIETPLRLPNLNHFVPDLHFGTLLEASLGRLRTLFSYYGNRELRCDAERLLCEAREVRVREWGLKWHTWTRPVTGQDRREALSGLVGHVTYTGPLTAHLGWLAAAGPLLVGLDTASGCGAFRVEPHA